MPKITLENGKEVEISKESYDEMCKSVTDEWPQERDEYWWVDSTGVANETIFKNDITDKAFIKRGNCFRTEEEAEMYALRIESLSKGFIPKNDEEFWFWNWLTNAPRETSDIYAIEVQHRTKEECQAWYDKYGKAWEFLYK